MLVSNDYIKLLTSFPPRPITSEEELELTQNMIDQLLVQGKLSQDEDDVLQRNYTNLISSFPVHIFEPLT